MICLDFDWQIDEFMVYCRSTQLRPQTMKSYEQTLRLFERWCLEQMEITAGNFVELPVPVQSAVPTSLSTPDTGNSPSVSAILRTASGISIEIREEASADFIKKLMGAVTNA